MWPIRMNMSWDECRQCLRCLELDAYGNMVSVLRAQGPFTEDKKKLLEELARVLHITNERHRAEVRRAVNDEKLSLIAEQLNGPNTWTDWAIEGRRTIPLLPRLKSHTTFTGLANSLSLVLAAANEKKIPITEQPQQQQQESIAKAKASTFCKEVIVEERPLKCSVSNHQGNTRGRKRKKSLIDVDDVSKNLKQNLNKKLNTDSDVNSVNIETRELELPLRKSSSNEITNNSSLDKSRCYDKSIMRHSITCTVSPMESANWDNNVNSINSIACHDNSPAQPKITTINENSRSDESFELENRLSYETDELETHDLQRNSIRSKVELDNITNDDSNTLTCDNNPLSPSKIDRISSPDLSQPSSPSVEVSATQTLTINSNSASLTDPGPPPPINYPILAHNKLPLEMLNHRNTMKTDIKFYSNNTININDLSNAKLNTKATNFIVVRKGSASGIKLSRVGKKVLAKVISNNGDRTVNVTPMSNSCNLDDTGVTNKTSTKTENMVLLDIRKDVSDETECFTMNNENAIDIFNSDTKTVLSNVDAHNLVQYSSEDCPSILAHHVDVIHTENNVIDDENDDSRGISLSENLEIEHVSDVPEQSGCEEILISSEPHVIIDGQTEIYNFESTDENVCEIQIEESVEEEYSTEIVSTDINVENLDYVMDDEETVSIPEDERGQYEQFTDFSDS